MLTTQKSLYLIILVCCFTISLTFRCLLAKELFKKISSDQQKVESRQEKALTQNQPQITINSPYFDAGEVYEGDEIVHTFKVRNTGTAQLNIEKVSAG